MNIAQRRLLMSGGLKPVHTELEKTNDQTICSLIADNRNRDYYAIASEKVITAYASWYFGNTVYTAPFAISTRNSDGVRWIYRSAPLSPGTNYTTNEIFYHGKTFYWAIGGGAEGNQRSRDPVTTAFKINDVMGGTYPEGYSRDDIARDILDYYYGFLG